MTDSSSDSGKGTDPSYVQRWKEQTTGFDRVRSVAFALQEPRTAGWIADEAYVSEPTTRNHLSRLVDLGILVTDDTSNGRTYYPDPIYSRLTALRELVNENSAAELAEQAVAIQRDIEAWKHEYEVDDPSGLRATVAGEELAAEEARTRLQQADDWGSAKYHLSLLRDAIDHYDTYTARPSASA
ncbi:winged helix-turn-helix domain-containing protein [Haladaptatus caseinilyticus]|uniref:winged helix-turn-helix domain-containing protein n=1 Tax=Haladaptatus caseinilyticus TaxID=2993314 RepID=UPI00224B5D35|nr:winged helix-turn-helix domain-containing protein [Haladaptatus caseinilyticus]